MIKLLIKNKGLELNDHLIYYSIEDNSSFKRKQKIRSIIFSFLEDINELPALTRKKLLTYLQDKRKSNRTTNIEKNIYFKIFDDECKKIKFKTLKKEKESPKLNNEKEYESYKDNNNFSNIFYEEVFFKTKIIPLNEDNLF